MTATIDNPHIARLDEMKADVLRRAANPEHVWDEKAIDWPLTKKSVVVEVGGYCGRWALQIAERYHCRLYVFEPQPWAWNVCSSVLGDKATVLPYGLGDESGMLAMRNWETDGASFVKAEGQGSGMVREVGAAFKELGIKRIDLMLMNIESYEYVLLPHMLDLGILPRRLMVQFHPWHDAFDEYGMALAKLHTRLGDLGYNVAWTYGILLTAWERD